MRTFFLNPLSYLWLGTTALTLSGVSWIVAITVLANGADDWKSPLLLVVFPVLAVLSVAVICSTVQVTPTTLKYRVLVWTAYEVPMSAIRSLVSFTLCDGLLCYYATGTGSRRKVYFLPRVFGRQKLVQELESRSKTFRA